MKKGQNFCFFLVRQTRKEVRDGQEEHQHQLREVQALRRAALQREGRARLQEAHELPQGWQGQEVALHVRQVKKGGFLIRRPPFDFKFI